MGQMFEHMYICINIIYMIYHFISHLKCTYIDILHSYFSSFYNSHTIFIQDSSLAISKNAIVGWCYHGTTERVSEFKSAWIQSFTCVYEFLCTHVKVTGIPRVKSKFHLIVAM